MPLRKRSNLSLNRTKRRSVCAVKTGVRRFSRYLTASETCTPPKKFPVPQRKATSCLKRLKHQSPYFTGKIAVTPSPCHKKIRKALNRSPACNSDVNSESHIHFVKRLVHQSPRYTGKLGATPSPCHKRIRKALNPSPVSNGKRESNPPLDIYIHEEPDFGITPIESENVPEEQSDLETIIDLLPRVLEKLSTEGFDKCILDFFKLVDEDKFPLTNIAFILWTEVVKWFQLPVTSQMRYSSETKMFWKLGYRVFGGRFINFMSGYKCGTQTTEFATRGYSTPAAGEINSAIAEVSKALRKSDLNIVFAEYYWTAELDKWNKSHPFSVSGETPWFYSPSYSECRKQLEVSCVDSTHLLTRARRKSCKGGLDGMPNTGWRKVAISKKTSLSLAMIDCIFEPMSVCAARTHFSDEVEKELRSIGYEQEADLCKDVRLWWLAEDDRGISATERIRMRIPLRERLLKHVHFAKFPPPGMFVNGWPTQLWEAVLANIDAKTLLYKLCSNHSYNVRAFSSMMGETYFAEMTLNDKRGHGTLTVEEVGHFINDSIEQLFMRLDPTRKFAYRTSRRPVYDLVERIDTAENEEPEKPRDHAFDMPSNRQSKQKMLVLDPNRNAVKRGSLGVRWESARRNESKLLLTVRQGLDQ